MPWREVLRVLRPNKQWVGFGIAVRPTTTLPTAEIHEVLHSTQDLTNLFHGGVPDEQLPHRYTREVKGLMTVARKSNGESSNMIACSMAFGKHGYTSLVLLMTFSIPGENGGSSFGVGCGGQKPTPTSKSWSLGTFG